MKIGSLYEIKKWYWLLFPSKDIAVATAHRRGAPAAAAVVVADELQRTHPRSAAAAAVSYADYWSREFNCNVSFVPQDSMFMLLEQDGNYCKILTTNGELGWIIYPENEAWTKNCIEEVNQ
jgi:hypothetical protein